MGESFLQLLNLVSPPLSPIVRRSFQNKACISIETIFQTEKPRFYINGKYAVALKNA